MYIRGRLRRETLERGKKRVKREDGKVTMARVGRVEKEPGGAGEVLGGAGQVGGEEGCVGWSQYSQMLPLPIDNTNEEQPHTRSLFAATPSGPSLP